MQQSESESPATGKGHGADLTSFGGLTQQTEIYAKSPSLAMVSEKARRHAAIAWVYREARKRRGSPIAWIRVRELERIVHHAWNGQIPENSEGRVFVRVVANHFAGLSGIPRRRIGVWCDRFAPWMDEDELDDIIELAMISPTLYSADSIARVIGIDIATRDYLSLTTIGACDFNKDARAKRRLAKRAARQRQKRALLGAKPRAQCVSQKKPWLSEGISERTWYRRQKDSST